MILLQMRLLHHLNLPVSDGTDGATVAAGIHDCRRTFSSSANATKYKTETAAASATAKMTLSSAGF